MILYRNARYRRATPDYLLAAQVEDALYSHANNWVFYGDATAKQDLLAAWTQLSPAGKAWLDHEVAQVVQRHHGSNVVVAYRYEKSGQPTRTLSGTSLTTKQPQWKSHAFRVPAGVILLHWGQPMFPLSSGAYGHEEEIILKPHLDEYLVEDLGVLDPYGDQQSPQGGILGDILRKVRYRRASTPQAELDQYLVGYRARHPDQAQWLERCPVVYDERLQSEARQQLLRGHEAIVVGPKFLALRTVGGNSMDLVLTHEIGHYLQEFVVGGTFAWYQAILAAGLDPMGPLPWGAPNINEAWADTYTVLTMDPDDRWPAWQALVAETLGLPGQQTP